MLSPSQCDRIDVVLVSPRNPLNIGAAARAMANFGFQRLSIVAPFAVNWMEAKSAVGAPTLLRDAQVFETLAEAIAHCTLVLGTGSLDKRKPVQRIVGLPEAGVWVRKTLANATDLSAVPASAAGPRIALLFGSEKHGLTADDLSWCHALIVIKTSETQPSMNLGQAVAVCLYEISRTAGYAIHEMPEPGIIPTTPEADQPETANHETTSTLALPDSEHVDRLATLIEETMEAVNYSTRGLRSANGSALRVFLRRLMPEEADLRRMMGLFRRILWHIGRRSGKV